MICDKRLRNKGNPPLTETTPDRWVSTTHRPMGFYEFVVLIAAIMALNPLAMDMMLPALPEIGAAFRVTDANHLQTVLSTFLLGFGVGQFVIGPLSDRYRPPPGADRRHDPLWHRERPDADRAEFRDAAARTRPAGPLDRGDAGDRDLGGARLLCRPADGERDVAGADDLHLGAGAGALARPAGDVRIARVAQRVRRAAAVRRRHPRLDRVAAAGDAGGRKAQVAGRARRARLFPRDADQPPDARLCARGRLPHEHHVRLRVLGAAGVHGSLSPRQELPARLRRDRARRRGRGLRQCADRRQARHARDLARGVVRLHGGVAL